MRQHKRARLDEFDKVEWFDICRKLKPDLAWDDYCAVWDEMQAHKAERARNRELH